jgi:hypothetical protein
MDAARKRARTLLRHVIPVDIGIQTDRSGVISPGREVDDVNGNRLLELDVPLVASVHRLDDSRLVPLWRTLQHPLGERLGLFNPDAAVAERASGSCKQRIGWRVVEIDVVGVREDELHVSQGVLRSRLLSECQCVELFWIVPIHRCGIDTRRPGFRDPQDLHVVAGEKLRISRGRRRGLALDDALGNVPIRTEHSRGHHGAEDWRLVLRSADDDAHLENRLATLARVQVE